MKLKKSFITHELEGEQVMVSTSTSGFSGLVRSNATAAFIVDCLKKDTSVDEIVAKMSEKYDAPADVMKKDVEKIIAKLDSIGAIEK